jgi:hypothetical protein
VTFGTETSSAIAGQFGVRIARDFFVIGEFGRMQNVLPTDVGDLLPLAEEIAEGILGVPVNIDVNAPALYGFGGVRWMLGGRRIAPFAEAGVGFAHLTGEIKVNGLDVEDLIAEFGDDFGVGDLTTDDFLLAFGGGVNIELTSAMSVDAGYRFTHIFADDPTGLLGDRFTPNTSMVYGAVKFLFGR